MHHTGLDIDDFVVIYKTYVRLYMENCIQAWSPQLQKEIQCRESVQRAATKLVPNTRNRSHDYRLYTTEESGENSSRRSIYCLVSRKYQVISSFSYSPVVIVQEGSHSMKLPSPAVKTRHKQITTVNMFYCMILV